MLPSWTEIWLWWTGFSIACQCYRKIHLSILAETCNNLFFSDQLKFWISKFLVRDGNQLIDVSSAAWGAGSTIPIGLTWKHSPYTGTVYQFVPILFHNPDQEFGIDDAEAKLFALVKSPHAVDGCKLVQHHVNKAITFNRKMSWTFICSHGKVMRNINDSHFWPDSVGKINILYQNAKRTKSKRSMKGKFFLCIDVYMNSSIHWIHLCYVLFKYRQSALQ